MWIWVLSSRVKSERGERVRYRVEHQDKIHIHAWACIILYLQRDQEWLVLISAFPTPYPLDCATVASSHLLSIISTNSCHFELFFDSPESSQSRASTAFPGTTAGIYLVAKTVSNVQFYWMNSTSVLQSGNKQTNKKNNDRLVHSWPNVVCFSSSKITFIQKKIYYLQFEDLFWNDNYKNREPSWVFKKQSLMETADIQEISSIWKNKKQ